MKNIKWVVSAIIVICLFVGYAIIKESLKPHTPITTQGSPTLVSPLNGSTTQSGVIGFTWTYNYKEPAKSYCYDIQIDASPSFDSTGSNHKETLTDEESVAQVYLGFGTHYWRVRVGAEGDYPSAWSSTWSFTIVGGGA